MNEFQTWLRNWECETPTVRDWYWRFCNFDERIDQLVKHSPFPVIGVKRTDFDFNRHNFLEEQCLRWLFRNLTSDLYAEVFVLEHGEDAAHRPVRVTKSSNAVMRVRAIMFQNEADAAWFKLSCVDKVCDAYAWKEL